MRQNLVLVFQFHLEHGIWQRLYHRCHYFNRVFLRQTSSRFRQPSGRLCSNSLLRQNHCAFGGNRYRMLEVRAQTSILRDRCPAVAQHLNVRLAGVHHRLDRDHHAFAQLLALPAPAIVRNLRILVQACTNSVTHKFADHTEPFRFHYFLYRGSHIAQRRSGLDFPDAALERSLRYRQQALRARGNLLTHRYGNRRIAVVAVQNYARVDRNNVSVTKHPLRGRNSVNHFLVHRGAQYTRVSTVALECRLRAQFPNLPGGGILEVLRRCSRLYKLPDMLEHLVNHLAAAPHLLDLLRRLDHDWHATASSSSAKQPASLRLSPRSPAAPHSPVRSGPARDNAPRPELSASYKPASAPRILLPCRLIAASGASRRGRTTHRPWAAASRCCSYSCRQDKCAVR